MKEIFGEKGFWIVMIVAVGLFVLMLFMGNGSGSSGDTVMVTPTAYSSYPDAVTNANAIIDSVNAYTEYTGKLIMDSTSGYMEDGFTLLQQNMIEEFDQIDSSINDLTGSVSGIQTSVSGLGTKIDGISGQLSTIKNNQTAVYKTSSNASRPTTETVEVPNWTVIPLEKDPKDTAATGTYYSSTSYKGNSIVDGLKSIGANSSFSNRRDIAKANGITNYSGTAAQNTALLNKLKSGTLKKGA